MSGQRTHERILHTDSWADIIWRISDGVNGAVNVCTRLCQEGKDVELGSPLGILQIFLGLDNAGIYGGDLWRLYRDVCGDDLIKLLAIVRAMDFGIVSEARVRLEFHSHHGEGLDHEAILAQLQKRFPGFGTRKAAA